MGTQDSGRKRMPNRERLTAEDDALNLIAREAEARLAAKRAARAEAREIRMKELEKQQNETSDDEERMSVGSRGCLRVEDRSDRDLLEKGSRASTLASLSRASSRRGSGDASTWADSEASVREMKDALVEAEEKYRKAMVSNAQLDNEKSKLMYQVDVLKDSLMELEEQLSESRREYEEKVKEFEREKHAHSILQFQFNEMKEMLRQSEELLTKQGIVLGPDLNANGETGAVINRLTDADSAQDSQTVHTGGDGMLGKAEKVKLKGKECDEGGNRELLEKTKNHTAMLQTTKEEVDSPEINTGVHLQHNQSERESPSLSPELHSGIADSQRLEGVVHDSTVGGKETRQEDDDYKIHNSPCISESDSVLCETEDQVEVNDTERQITKKKDIGEKGADNGEHIVQDKLGVKRDTASCEDGMGLENGSEAEFLCSNTCQEMVTKADSAECESIHSSEDMGPEKERTQNINVCGDQSAHTEDTAIQDEKTFVEDIMKVENSEEEARRDPVDSIGNDKEECAFMSALTKEDHGTVETVAVDFNQELGSVDVSSQLHSTSQKDGTFVDDGGNPTLPKSVSDSHSMEMTDRPSGPSTAASSQSESGRASGKKKKKKKKSKQKHKGEAQAVPTDASEKQVEAKQEREETQESKTNDHEDIDAAPEVEAKENTRIEECLTEPIAEAETKASHQTVQDEVMTHVEEEIEHDGKSQNKEDESKILEDFHVSVPSTEVEYSSGLMLKSSAENAVTLEPAVTSGQIEEAETKTIYQTRSLYPHAKHPASRREFLQLWKGVRLSTQAQLPEGGKGLISVTQHLERGAGGTTQPPPAFSQATKKEKSRKWGMRALR
ncbi:leucine-rich repeat flightless-interacting protein 1-like isoform X2 [Arapaima gigas]